MANFNPGLNPTGDPDYSRSSREPSLFNPSARNQEISTRNLMMTFGALGSAAKGVDKLIQDSAQSELKEGYDRLTGAQGVDVAAANAVVNPENSVMNPTGGDSPPTEEQKTIAEGMSRLTAAKEQGKLSNTHYYAQLESLVRSVKSRYPGYGQIIDRQIEGIAGVTPANALRQSLLHDMSKAEEAQKERWDQEQKAVEQHSDDLSQADYQAFKEGRLPAKDAMIKIQDRRARIKNIEAQTAELRAQQLDKSLSEDDAKKGASKVAFDVHQLALDNVKTLVEQAKKDIEMGTYDPQRYMLLLNQARQDYTKNALMVIQKGVGNTLDVNQTNQIIAESAKAFDDYAQVFTKGDSGYFDYLKAEIEGKTNRNVVSLMGDKNVGVPLQALGAVRKVAGEQAATELLNMFQKSTGHSLVSDASEALANKLNSTSGDPVAKRDPVANTMLMDQTASMSLGDVFKGNPLQHIENLVKLGKDNPTYIRQSTSMWANFFSNSSLDKKLVENAANVMFGEGNKDFLKKGFKDADSRWETYQRLTSPQITQNMERLKGTQAYENYKDWVYDGFLTVLKGKANKLQAVAERPYLDLKFDEATGHFDLVPNAEGEKIAKEKWYNQSIPFNAATILENLLGRGIYSDVRELNMAVDNVSKVLEGDKYKSGEQIRNLVSAMAVAQRSPEKKGLWQWVAKSIQLPDKKQLDQMEFGGKHPNFTEASGTNEEPRGLVSLINQPEKAIDALKNAFAQGESGGNYNRLVNTSTHPKEISLTSMPIRDVLAYQQTMLDAGNKSSAAGKYQVVSKTLRSLVKEGVVSMDDRYDEQTQERVADALLERRGLKEFLDGKLSLNSFMRRLGDEWEIIKKSPAAYHKTMYELERLRTASN